MKFNAHSSIVYFFIYLFFVILVLATSGFPFFFDTIQLASKSAHFFYENHFSSIILPNEIDSGHIPSLGFYLAFVWSIFGKTLFVSHLAMLPFVIGIVHQSIQLTKRLFPDKWSIAALILLLADATLLAQCTLVSPDVVIVFFFLMALNHLFSNKQFWYSLALTGLVLTSMRGMMCVAGLLLANVLMQLEQAGQKEREYGFKYPAYLPAILVAVSFLGGHYFKTGWIGYHKEMPWNSLFETVGWNGFIRNVFILGWRLIDFGRLLSWIFFGVCIWHYYKYRPALNSTIKTLFMVFFSISLFLSYAVLFHKNLSAHRYLLPIYLTFMLLVSYYLFYYISSVRIKKLFFISTLLCMLSGNFWVYPDRIAKGWDSTLAYLPYFPLRQKMMEYMKTNNIPINETGTLFPNKDALEYIDLSGNRDSFAGLDLKTNNYVFYSNIFNDITDQELFELKNKWHIIKDYHFLQVKIQLYQRP